MLPPVSSLTAVSEVAVDIERLVFKSPRYDNATKFATTATGNATELTILRKAEFS